MVVAGRWLLLGAAGGAVGRAGAREAGARPRLEGALRGMLMVAFGCSQVRLLGGEVVWEEAKWKSGRRKGLDVKCANSSPVPANRAAALVI